MATKPKATTSRATTAAQERLRTERALGTIEAAERLAVHAYAAIETGDATEAMRLLDALTRMTTSTSASLVKTQALSDKVSALARAHVANVNPFHVAAS